MRALSAGTGPFRAARARPTVRSCARCACAFVYPVATWGCGSWSYSVFELVLLQHWWRKKIRIILRKTKSDHMTIEEHHERSKIAKIEDLLEQRRLRYIGHVVRYPADRWVRRCLTAKLAGADKKETRRLTWVKGVRSALKRLNCNLSTCRDRDHWRDLCAGKAKIPRRHAVILRVPQAAIRAEGAERRRNCRDR